MVALVAAFWTAGSAHADPGGPVPVASESGRDAPAAGASAAADTSAARLLRLESVEITGNDHTSNDIIRRHLRLRPGDAVTAETLESSRRRLLATDYFTEVVFSTRPGTQRGAVILVIEVKERSFPSFETGFGYHDLYGWFLTLGGLRFDNLFGVESQLRIGARLGWRLAGLDVDWAQALSPDGSHGWGARFYAYGTDQRFYAPVQPTGQPAPPAAGVVWNEFQQQISRVGGEVSFGLGHRHSARLSIGLRAESIEPDSSFKDVDSSEEFGYESFPAPLRESLGKTAQTGVFLRVVRDSRDTPVYPSSGTFLRLSLVSNNTWLGGDQIFATTEADVRKHIHLRDGWVVSGRLAGGIASSGTPYYDRFYLGGVYSIRGFANLSLSDPGGDDGYWLANLELRWPLAGGDPRLPRVVGLVFADAGQGYRRDTPFDYHDINVGAGYGLRLRLPWLGTLGLDVGIPLTDERTGQPFVVYGVMGFSF
jgi:outer membrane protein insertion porin family